MDPGARDVVGLEVASMLEYIANASDNQDEQNTTDTGEPFDVVYTWVNHADPGWKNLYAQANSDCDMPKGEHASSNDPARYVNRGELYWSIRSVHKYASWVRRIYVVTNCALPDEVAALGGVVHVPHEVIFPDLDCLPTFNSHAIETVLHRIPGLSERFLYLNDDFFLCRPLTPDDFFYGKQGVRFTLSPHDIPYDRTMEALRPVDTGAIHAASLLRRDFNCMPRKKLQHAPYPLMISTMKDIERKYADSVLATRAHRFRQKSDVAMATTLHAYYAQCMGRGEPGSLRARYIDISDWRFLGLIHPFSPLHRGKYDTLCLNEISELRCGQKLRDIIVLALMRRLFS